MKTVIFSKQNAKRLLSLVLVIAAILAMLPAMAVTADAAGVEDYLFDWEYYYNKYPDLQRAFGKNQSKLRNHYNNYGKKEGRCPSDVFDPVFYLNSYNDLKAAFGNNYTAAYNHFVQNGIREGRKASASFSVEVYKNNYDDLRKAFGTAASDNWEYIRHWAQYGRKEGRNATSKIGTTGNTSNTSGMTDVTRSFEGKKIIIKSVENNRYLCADNNISGIPAVCNRTSASKSSDSWEVFTVSVTSDGWAGFKAFNGKWLSARIDTTNSPLRAVSDKLQSWEAFRIYLHNGNYYLKSQANGKWLCVRVDTSNAPVQAYASAASTWERFSITVVNNGTAGSNTSNSTYAPYTGIDYTAILNAARSGNKISSTEYNNRVKLLAEAQKMVTVLWTAPVSFHTWKAGSGSYNSNKEMQYNCSTSTTNQYVKGYTYKGIPYAANAGKNNYDAEGWLSLINESGISKTTLEGTVTYLDVTRYNTTFRGVDCSGFVHKAYEAVGSYTYKDSNRLSCSNMMSSSSWKKISASQAMPGDILLKSGHVMIYLGKTTEGKIAVFESVADGENGTSGCRYYEFNSISGYSYYRFTGIAQ